MLSLSAKLPMTLYKKLIRTSLLLIFAITLIGAKVIDVIHSKDRIKEDIVFAKIENKINALSPQEMIVALDSLLSLKKIHPRLLSIVNKKIKRDFSNYRPVNKCHPANQYYQSWNTTKSHPYKESLWKSDTTVLLKLNENDNCGYHTPFEGIVTSHYGPRDGKMHYGIDLNLYTGDTVKAAFSGEIRLAKWQSGYGKTIVIRHYNGLETIYGHLSKHLVKTGDFVEAGAPIGRGGNTGNSRGSHLHLETRFKGRAINPEVFIDFANGTLKNDTLILKRSKKGYYSYLPETYIRKIRQNRFRVAMVYGERVPFKNELTRTKNVLVN